MSHAPNNPTVPGVRPISEPARPVGALALGARFGEGWTVEICRERMATCRRAARDYRAMPSASRYSYRFLNAQFYMQHRDRLAALLSREEESDLGTSLEQSRGRAGYKEEGTALFSSPNIVHEPHREDGA